jgi:hypothetical protein
MSPSKNPLEGLVGLMEAVQKIHEGIGDEDRPFDLPRFFWSGTAEHHSSTNLS